MLPAATTLNQTNRSDRGSLPDGVLVRRLRGPDGEAVLAEIHRRHAAAALRQARRHLGDRSRAEEVVQEVLLDLWMRPERYSEQRGSLGAFIAIQARCRALDVVRSDQSRTRREARDALLARGGDVTAGPDDDGSETVERVLSSLRALPERERVPLSMALDGERTYRQVAASLGLPEGTVKSRIRSGLTKIRSEVLAVPA